MTLDHAVTLAADEHSANGGVEPIAVIGIACRLPGAQDVGAFWRNLVDGVESIKITTPQDHAGRGVPEHELTNPAFVPASSVLDDAEYFDAAFFGMSAREAQVRDPQHRLFLELAHTVLEDGGYVPEAYEGDIGVYVGSGEDVYQWQNTRYMPSLMAGATTLEIAVSSHPDYVATLASYKLDLRGPSFTVHTACSSSLVAIHEACEALRNGECDMALGGGVNVELPLGGGYVYVEGGILSADGHCRAFDAKASGTVGASGGAVLLLKRLADAIADGDHIRCVILGNAINNDGAQKGGFTAPSEEGQAAVIAQALALAGADPRTIGYVEAHGTGTLLGDPLEVAALSRVYRPASPDLNWCAIGSVKSNIGHMGPASGAAGMVKAVLALEHGLIPPSINCDEPNPKIAFDGGPFYVNTTLSRWEDDGGPRRAAVSSFGMGGTNAHVVLQEAPPATGGSRSPAGVQLLQLSARSASAVEAAAQRLAAALDGMEVTEQPPAIEDVAYTLRVGRREFTHRLAVTASDRQDAARALTDHRRRITGTASARPPKIALMFPGQGAQYAGMGAELYQSQPRFAAAVDECADLLGSRLGADLRSLIFSQDADDTERLRQTAIAQPALFAVEYAMARLWEAAGIEAAAMIGHSIGEYVAATLAGVFSLSQALDVVCERGRLMQAMPPGSMLAVQLDEADLGPLLPDGLAIAAVNGTRACVVSGPEPLVRRFAEDLRGDDIGCRVLATSHAFHSQMMEPSLPAFLQVVSAVTLSPPARPFISNVTGDWIIASDACDPGYWTRHLRQTVRFGDGLATLLRDGGWTLLECGPGRQLCGLARLQQGKSAAYPSLPSRVDEAPELEVLLGAAGRLWTSGARLNRDALGAAGRRVSLPAYPWERKYYWIKPGDDDRGPAAAGGSGPRPLDQWFAVPGWRQLPPVTRTDRLTSCLLLGDQEADELAGLLQTHGTRVVRVRSGQRFQPADSGGYVLSPGSRADHDALVTELISDGGIPAMIVHAWALEPAGAESGVVRGDLDALWRSQDEGYFSAINLVQALSVAQTDRDIDLVILTAGTEDVTRRDLTRPEHATIGGIVDVVPLELPWLRARRIDVDAAAPGPAARQESRQESLRLLTAEITAAGSAERAVALRDGRRWRREFNQATVPADPDPAIGGQGLRRGGTYLVTGGTGGIGITLAEDMARRAGANIAITARTGLPPRDQWDDYLAADGTATRTGRAIAAVRRIEEIGSQVLVLTADVSTVSDMRAVRETVISRFGAIHGIVHAAGMPGGGLAEVKERSVATEVMRPKLAGTLVLREVFGDLPLDFVALCSSVTAIAGGFGQVDYCAANRFLDAYARSSSGWSCPVVSVNWGSWVDVGMAAEVSAPRAFRALQRGDAVRRIRHPILTGRHDGGEGQPDWCSGLIAPSTHWVLGDHRIGGVPVFPGTGYLDLAHAAATTLSPVSDGVVELRDVVFIEPMAVADGSSAEVQVVFEPASEGLEFKILSKVAGRVRTHAQGHVAWRTGDNAPRLDLAEVSRRCSLAVREGGGRPVSQSGAITFGPHWGNVKRVRLGASEELSVLEANPVARQDIESWALHPAMLDEAVVIGDTPDGEFIPLGYGRVTVYAPLAASAVSHLTIHQTGNEDLATADVTICDEEGRILVDITDFTMRRFNVGTFVAGLTSDEPAAPLPSAKADLSTGIRPADGAEAFARVIGSRLGSQVVISVKPVDEIVLASQQLTQDSITSEADFASPTSAGRSPDASIYVAPRTELESTIAKIWADVLGAEQVSVTDDFFEIGGNSLIAVQIITVIRKAVGVRLPMRTLFQHPTVEGAAVLIEDLLAGGGAEAAGPEDEDAGPLAQAQP